MTSLLKPMCENHFLISDEIHGFLNFVFPPTQAF